MSDGDFGAALVGGLIGYSLGSSSQSLSRAEKEEIKLDARESWSNLSVNDKRDHLKSCTKDQASSKQGSLITLTIVILIFTVFGAMVMSTMGGSAGIFTEFSERMAQNPGGDANTFLDKSKLNQGV